MDHQSHEITRRKPLDLESRGFTKRDPKEPWGNGIPYDREDSREPWGIRTPNGQIWAHDLEDLYDVRPSEDWPDPVYWSVSMMREFELASKDMLDASKTKQQQAHSDSWKVSPKKPWPLLRFSDKFQRRPNMGAEDEKIDYCRNLHRTPWTLKSSRSDEDYYVMNLNEKLRSAPCFCSHCEDPELIVPTSSLRCAKQHFDVHCKCQNRRQSIKKSKSLPDICSAVDHRKSDHLGTTEFSHRQYRQRTLECIDTEQIPYSPETSTGIKRPPKLEEFIPYDFLPDVLLVNDDDDCATGKQGLREGTHSVEDRPDRIGEGDSQRRYHRVLPAIPHKGRELRTAHLNLSRFKLCGTGNHSSVYHASFLPPPPLTTNFRSLNGYVTVIAKTTFPSSRDRAHLDNEAEVLNKLSTKANRHMQQEWCGFNLLPGLTRPVPVGPVVPKFYGYYKPEPQADSTEHLSPILLVEDCGVPVKEGNLSQANKEEIYSLFLRLHHARFVQNSAFVRNILIQPGPLTRPPIERSLTTPSFRIIDYGRAEHRIKPARVPEECWKVVWENRFAAQCIRDLYDVKVEIRLRPDALKIAW
ncbi:hypothetical protein MMC27_008177 [Xylographa pallens]|nr:hypothetical protein [Xylographa pallens]